MFLILVTTKVQLSLLLHLIYVKVQTAFYMLMYKICVVCILLIYLSLSIHTEENYFILFSLPTYHLTNSTNILNLKNYTLIVPIFPPLLTFLLSFTNAKPKYK